LLINLPGLKDVYVGCKPQKIRFSDLKWFQEECQKKEHVFFLESLRQCIKAEPKEKQFLRTCGFRSCLVIPLRDSGKLIGILFVSVESEVVQRFQKMLEELGIVGNIFGRLILKERLLQSQLNYEKDRQANFSKLELVSSLGHEMRTPLMGITGLVDALEDCSLTSAQQPLVSGIRESAHQIIKFLREVEDLSRMEAGEVQLKQEKFNPYELVLRVSKSFEPELNERGMSLDIHVSRSVPDVFSSDSQRFVQILFNLMQNALEHADHGVVRVTLAYSDTKDMLFLSVSDSGPGITAEQQAGLFQKFVRLNSIKIGSGVGLAITHHLVKLLGGEIDVEAIEGKGTVFSVSIPNCVTSYPLISEDFDYDVPAQNILFVDDNSINQKIAENLLQISGHNVDIAENGFEALQKLNASENYDMVFMDLQMPVMDGFTAIRAIRGGAAGRKYSTIPIVAVTAGTHANDFEECHECGADEVLVKPFEAVRFRKLVADFHFCRIRTGGCAGFHAIFDKESALLKMGADEEVLQEALELFLDEAKSRWEEIQIAVDSKDPNQLRFMLHSLRGVSSSLGFEALEQQCLTISELLKSGNIEYAFKLAGSLESLYFDTVQQVKKQG
jgi:signal transduction histidine kinase/DNA-binding response OmpR family regulator